MTVGDQDRRSDSVGNGTLKTFPYDFKLANPTDLNVLVDGVLQLYNIDYVVDSIGDTGGTFTFVIAPGALALVTALGDNPYTQSTEYQNNEDVPSVRFMQDLDKLMMLLQQIREEQKRSFILAVKSQLGPIVVEDPTAIDKFMRVKSLSPLTLDFATLAVLAGAVPIPLSAANGGTGINGSTAGTGFLLIGNGAGYTLARLTAGTNIGIVNAAGSVTINNTYSPPTPPISQGMYGTRGNKSKNNGATPDTKFDLIADIVQCWNPTDNSFLVKKAPGTLTIDFAAAGPIALGRDQAAAFAINSWLYPYWIMKADGTTSGTVSLTPPPAGPVLPATYIAFAPCNPVRWDGSSHIIRVTMDGPTTWYQGRQSMLSNGAAVVETPIPLSTAVPPGAGTIHSLYAVKNGGSTASTVSIRTVAGVDLMVFVTSETGGILAGRPQGMLSFQNVSQQALYIVAAAVLDLWISGYTFSSGAM